MMSNLDKKAQIDLVVPLAKGILPKLVTKAASSVIDKFERKRERAGKGFTLFILNEHMDDIIKMLLEKSLE